MRRTLRPLLALLLLACSSPEVDPTDECGASTPCPSGFECTSTTPRRCAQKTVPDTAVLTVGVTGQGAVAVAGQATCRSASCAYTVARGTALALTATADAGWRFARWSEGCGGTPAISVTLDGARSCAATFVAVEQTTFAMVLSAEDGGEASSDAGLACTGSSCSGRVAAGDTVEIRATAGTGHRWGGWRGSGDCDGKQDNPLRLTVSGDVMCRATFVEVFTVSVSSTMASAAVSVSASGCGGASCTVDKGATVTLTAGSVAGARFTGWTGEGACAGSEPSVTFTVTASAACVATYAGRVRVSGAVAGGLGGAVVATSPDASAECAGSSCTTDAGRSVTLVAPTVAGHRLTGWTGCQGTTAGSGITVVATADVTCTATYATGVSVSGTVIGAAGAVEASAPGGSCAAGACSVDAGATVTLTAPDLAPGFRFRGWTGDAGCAGTNRTLVLVDVGASVTCSAAYVRRLRVQGAVESGLVGEVSAAASDPLAVCSGGGCTVDAGLTVTLHAPDVAGHRFLGWSGAACDGDAPTLTVTTEDAAVSCVARYARRVHVSAAASGATATVILASAAPSVCDAAGCTLDAGDDVLLTAPDLAPDFRFAGWSGGAGCAGLTRTIELAGVRGDVACLAGYVRRWTISVGVEEGVTGHVAVTPADPTASCDDHSCTVDDGTQVTLAAPGADGTRFYLWSGSGPCDGAAANPLVLTAGAAVTCTATYVDLVTVTAQPGGAAATVTVTAGACTGSSCVVDKGTQVTLQAQAAEGFRFTGWSGDPPCSGTDPTLVFTATAATACTAGYVARYQVTGRVQDGLSGAVTASSAPPAVCAGASCVADAGASVTLVAPAIDGYRATGWTGCTGTVSGSGLTVVASGDLTCTATYALGVSVSGTIVGASGQVTAESTSPGATCGLGTCALDAGGSVKLTTEDLSALHRFLGWSGGSGCGGVATSVTIGNVQSSVSCTATWVRRYTVTGAMPVGVSGAVLASSSDPSKVCTTSACTVDSGKSVTLEAPAVNGMRFTGWQGAGCGNGSPVTLSPVANMTCTAQYAVTITVKATAAVGAPTLTARSTSAGATCAGASCTLDAGGDVTLTTTDPAATQPGTTWRFKGWSGDPGCTAASLVSPMTAIGANRTCEAGWVQRFKVTGTAPSGTVLASSSDDPSVSCPTSSACVVDKSKSVTLVAPTIAGYRFTGWSAGCGTDPTTTVVPVADLVCDAKYVRRYTVTASVSAAGGGSLAISGGGCTGSPCTVDEGTTVKLDVTPESSEYVFGSWTGCSPSGTAPSFTLLNTTATCVANFKKRQYTVTATAGTGGSVAVSGGSCTGSPCTVDSGTTVKLDVTPDAEYDFSSWSGCSPSGTNPHFTLLNTNATCLANFKKKQYTVTVTPGSGGSLTVSGGGCTSSPCTVDSGVTVKVDVMPDAAHNFSSWSGCSPSGTAPSFTFLNVNATCTALFVLKTYTVSATAGPGGTVTAQKGTAAGTPACPGNSCTVDAGTTVRLTATKTGNNHFTAWSGGGVCNSTSNPLDILDTSAACTASFAADPTFTATGVAAPAAGPVPTATAPAGTCTGGTCSGVPAGTIVTFKASSATGYVWKSWSGCSTSTSTTITVTVNADVTCTATYQVVVTGVASGVGTGTLSGASTGSCTAPSRTSVSCTVDVGGAASFTAAPDLGSVSDGWSGSGCAQGANPNQVLVSPAGAATTCTVRLEHEWAVSLGDVEGLPDSSAAGALVGNSVRLLGSNSHGIWLHDVDAEAGELNVPTFVMASVTGVRGLAMIGEDALILARSATATTGPMVARVRGGTKVWATTVGFNLDGFTVVSHTAGGIVASSDGAIRVGGQLEASYGDTANGKFGRLTTLAKDSTPLGDVLLCEATEAAPKCLGGGQCNAASVVAVADVPGQGTAMVLTTTGLPKGFVVLLMSYAGAVIWANDVFPGATLLGTPSLAVLPDGRIAVGGTSRETGGGSGSDGYVVVFKANGNGGLSGGGYGFTIGRPSGASLVNELVHGVGGTSSGQILLAGEASDTMGSSTDAWLAVISADGTLDASMAVGGDGDDRFVAAFEAPGNAAYLVGTTGSFGLGSTDMWGVRTLPSWRLTFPAAVAGHRRVVGAGTGPAPTIIGNLCTLVFPGGVSTSTNNAAVDVMTPAFARQAP